MSEIKTIKVFNIDDCVKMTGGKCKGCEGVIVNVMKQFCLVRLTKDKKGNATFSEKPNKCKRDHISIITQPAMEMPSQDNLKVVDDLEPGVKLLESIDKKITGINNIITEIVEEEPKQNATLIDENGVKSELPTIDDAINLREENRLLKLQVESLVSWQTHASKECATLKKQVEDLTKQQQVKEESIIKLKKEELIDLINNI